MCVCVAQVAERVLSPATTARACLSIPAPIAPTASMALMVVTGEAMKARAWKARRAAMTMGALAAVLATQKDNGGTTGPVYRQGCGRTCGEPTAGSIGPESPKIVEVLQVQYNDRFVDVPVVKQDQVPSVQRAQKTVEKPQVQYVDRVADIPAVVQQQVSPVQKVQKIVEVTQVQNIERVVEVPAAKKRHVPSVGAEDRRGHTSSVHRWACGCARGEAEASSVSPESAEVCGGATGPAYRPSCGRAEFAMQCHMPRH